MIFQIKMLADLRQKKHFKILLVIGTGKLETWHGMW